MRFRLLTCALLALGVPTQAQGRVDRAPAVGMQAPDFTLHRLQADGTPSKEKVRLSELAAKKPVALIFGSYT